LDRDLTNEADVFGMGLLGGTAGRYRALAKSHPNEEIYSAPKPKTSDTAVKKTLISLAFVFSSLVGAPAITLGVYDIAQTMTGKPLAYEEIFVDQRSAKGWVGTNQKSVYDFATTAWAKGRTPIISIEPFSGDPLDEIVSGKRDKELANIASQLARYGGPAIIRWGHEMETHCSPGEGNRWRNISGRTAT
jgi:hypothetical protein